MMEVTKTKAAIVDMMNGVMDGVSIFVSFILGYLIVYASRFMLKKRKMEFGVYLTLGMSRVKIAGILWMETIWMGVICSGSRAGDWNGTFPAYVSGSFLFISGRCVQICFCDFRKSSGEIYCLLFNYLCSSDDFQYHSYWTHQAY